MWYVLKGPRSQSVVFEVSSVLVGLFRHRHGSHLTRHAAGETGNGLVVANDAHPKRVHQLIETIQRHSRPAAERARFVVPQAQTLISKA